MTSTTVASLFTTFATLALLPNSARADEAGELRCREAALLAAPTDSSDSIKYAPDRDIDILNLSLDVTPDFQQRTVTGEETLTFKPLAQPLAELRLDAVDLNVQSVTGTAKIDAFQVTDSKLVITFAAPVSVGNESTVVIHYSAEPEKGLYFRTPEMGYRPGDTHLFTQGEAIEARHWYPCFDAPNEKFTSEITCHVPEGMTVLSNGKLLSRTEDAVTGLVAFHWKQDKPHSTYLISLLAGYFKNVEDKYRDIPIAFYTPASEIGQAASSFQDTKDALGFYEKEIGVPYPWDKYDQVCVNDFVAGGMENTSITTLTDGTLFTEATENLRSSQGLMAHELAHQWFGDLVTCKDWSDLWLNEGFATYYALLYEGRRNGRDSMLYGLYHNAQGILAHPDDTKPIVYRKYRSPDEQFSYLAYPKGGWVLHMLRSQLGEDLYRRCIRTYLQRHQYGNVVTEDLRAVIEELSGRSYDRFFDQWVYHAHYPELNVNYSWDERTKLARVSIAQDQKLSDDVFLFQFPLSIRFKCGAENLDRTVLVQEKSEDFYFALPEAPKLVRFDPLYTILAKIKFHIPDAMLPAQLKEQKDVIGRILAIEQLATRTDHASVRMLGDTLESDPFYGVRIEAAHALRQIHNEESLRALEAGQKQRDARVRQPVVQALGAFYESEAYEQAVRIVDTEHNPAILASAIRALGKYARPEVRDRLLRFLGSNSYENELADAAIDAMRAQDDPSYLEPLEAVLKDQEPAFTSRGFGQALEAVAYLARHQEKKAAEREFLLAYVNHRKRSVQMVAIRALGTLDDSRAISILQTYAGGKIGSPVQEAAERAIKALRSDRKPADESRELRNDVLDLKKENRELRKNLDDLKRRLDAEDTKPAHQ